MISRRSFLFSSTAVFALTVHDTLGMSMRLRLGGGSLASLQTITAIVLNTANGSNAANFTSGVSNTLVGLVRAEMNPILTPFLQLSGATFTITAGGSNFQMANGIEVRSKSALSPGSYSVTIQASASGLAPVSQTFSLTAAAFSTSITFVNESNSVTMPAGQSTACFGFCFRDGDIPPGTAPIFTVSSTVQTFSAGLQTYWPSGFLKYASFMLLPTFSVAANGSQVVTITNGGSWPYTTSQYANATSTVSGRTLTELYAQSIVVNTPPYPSVVNNGRTSTTLGAWLNGDANQYRVLKTHDGAAGTVWKISTNMTTAAGGTADGQLVVDHHVALLNDASAALAGCRWLGTIRQPFYNQNSGPFAGSGSYVVFKPPNSTTPSSGINLQTVGPGGTGTAYVPMPFHGNDGNDLDVVNFTAASGNVAIATATSNWHTTSDVTAFPVVFSSITHNTSAPSGYTSSIQNNGFAIVVTDPNTPATNFGIFYSGIATGAPIVQYSWSTSFTGTATPTVGVYPFCKIAFASPQGRMIFFQGTGSKASETTLRATHPPATQQYWVSSSVIPPFNTSVTGSNYSGVIIPQIFSNTWFPYSIGPMPNDQPSVGDHPDIGIFPNYHVQDFYNSTENTDIISRIVGLSGTQGICDFTDASTDTIPNLGNIGISYTLPNPNPNSLNISFATPFFGAGSFTNYPSGGVGPIGYKWSPLEHEPTYAVWPYLTTGEMQFLDLSWQQAQSDVLGNYLRYCVTGAANGGTTNTWYALSGWNQFEMRQCAWAVKAAQWAAMVYPRDPSSTSTNPIFTDGTNLAQYLTDIATAASSYALDQFQTSVNPTAGVGGTAYAYANGFWAPYAGSNYRSYPWGASGGWWQFFDYIAAMSIGVARNDPNGGSPAARNFIEFCGAGTYKAWQKDGAGQNLWWIMSNTNRFIYLSGQSPDGQTATGFVSNAQQLVCGGEFLWNNAGANGGAYISWAPNYSGSTYLGPAFQINNLANGTTANFYTPTNGDCFMPSYYNTPTYGFPSALAGDTPYYAVNMTYSGGLTATFDLAVTPGGSPIHITDSGSSMSQFFRPAAPPDLWCQGYPGGNIVQFWYQACWAVASGCAGFGVIGDIGGTINKLSLLGDCWNRVAVLNPGNNTNQYSSPGWGYIVGDSMNIDARYCYQAFFSHP